MIEAMHICIKRKKEKKKKKKKRKKKKNAYVPLLFIVPVGKSVTCVDAYPQSWEGRTCLLFTLSLVTRKKRSNVCILTSVMMVELVILYSATFICD